MIAIILCFILFFMLLFSMNVSQQSPTIEGVTNNASTPSYQSYSGNDPMILAQKNAANIEFLQGRLNDLESLKKTISSLKTEVDSNKNAINQMGQIAANHISNTTGISNVVPPSISNMG